MVRFISIFFLSVFILSSGLANPHTVRFLENFSVLHSPESGKEKTQQKDAEEKNTEKESEEIIESGKRYIHLKYFTLDYHNLKIADLQYYLYSHSKISHLKFSLPSVDQHIRFRSILI